MGPFEVLDQEGVRQIVEMATEGGSSVKPNLKQVFVMNTEAILLQLNSATEQD